jgi:hypothetical protein
VDRDRSEDETLDEEEEERIVGGVAADVLFELDS